MDYIQANIQEIREENIVVFDRITYVDVVVVVNMWGSIREIEARFLLSDWEEAEKKGYFLY